MPLHDSVVTDQSKMTTSFNLMKKRKKRKDLDKLIVRRQYNHVRTASFQDFHKISNLNDGNCVMSSTDDTATLLNSNDESIDYYANSVNRHKSKILCCNHNKFLIFSVIFNILTIAGCILLAVLLFVNKKNLDNWRYDEDRDLSKMKIQIERLQLKSLSSTTISDIIEIMNQTIINNTLHLQSLEDQYQSKIIDRIKVNIKRINRLQFFYNKITNFSDFILVCNKNVSGGDGEKIANILFQPSDFEMKSYSKNSTAVLLSLSEYKDFLTFRKTQSP